MMVAHAFISQQLVFCGGGGGGGGGVFVAHEALLIRKLPSKLEITPTVKV
jgi:NAD(P)H-hydrate repair Nnr-like enzyme with NAD(P)H-hydrate epimerase domain